MNGALTINDSTNQRLITYALMKSLFDEGRDYLDCVAPFVFGALESNSGTKALTIQKKLQDEHSVEIPIHVLENILRRAVKLKLVATNKKKSDYRLTEKGLRRKDRVEGIEAVSRRINALTKNMIDFFASNNVELTPEDAIKIVFAFVHENGRLVVSFLDPMEKFDPQMTGIQGKTQKLFLEFIFAVDVSEPNLYQTLRDLFLGAIISESLTQQSVQQFEILWKKKLRKIVIYLDTNLVFSLLRMHDERANIAANELLILLKQFDFELRVLPATLSEISSVVRHFRSVSHKYPFGIRVDSIFSSLKRKGWKDSDIQEFIFTLETRLEKLNISVDNSRPVDLTEFKPIKEERFAALEKYKPDQRLRGKSHDMSAIEIIEDIRSSRVYTIEDSKVIFLTSDHGLSAFKHDEYGHRDDGSVCEVILDRFLTNLLWIKRPNLKLPLIALVSAHSRDLLVSKRVWDRFYEVLQRLYKEGSLNQNHVSMLLYHNYIEDFLLNIDDSQTKIVTPEFVLERVQEVEKKIDDRILAEIRIKEQTFKEFLESEIDSSMLEKDREWMETIELAKRGFQEMSSSISRKIVLSARILITVLLLGGIAAIWLMLEPDNFAQISGLSSLIGLVLLVFNWSFGNWRDKLERRLNFRIYAIILSRSKFDAVLKRDVTEAKN